MGLMSKLFGSKDKAEKNNEKNVEKNPVPAPAPVSIVVPSEPGAIFSPVAGTVVALPDVPDPVFASGALGPGCGVKPASGEVYAPVTGTVTVTSETGHALGFAGDDGAEVLVHIGIDTVEMGGKGFTCLVKQGQRVSAGDPVTTFSREAVAAAGFDDIVIVAVSNADPAGTSLACEAGFVVSAGAKLLSAQIA